MIEQKQIRITFGTLKVEACIKHDIIMLRKQVLQERRLTNLTSATDNGYRKVLRETEQAG